MKISNIGYDYRHGNNFCINRPIGSGDFMVLLLKTPAYFILDGKRQHTNKNSVIIYKKGTPQHYGSVGCEYVNDWIHFDMDNTDLQEFKEMGLTFDTVLSIDDITTLSELIKNMCYEKYSLNQYKEKSAELYIKLFFTKLAEQINHNNNEKSSIYHKELSALRTEIYTLPQNDWNIGYMAAKLALSQSYFQHIYKDYFGVSAISDVVKSRIEHSKYLLFSTGYSLNIISEMCGYKNDVHFMRQFKKLEGISPTQYRNRIKISETEVEKSKNYAPYVIEA